MILLRVFLLVVVIFSTVQIITCNKQQAGHHGLAKSIEAALEVGMNPNEKPSDGLRDVALKPVKWVFGSLRSMWHSLKNFKAAISSTKNVIVDKYRGVKKGDANQTD